MKTNIINNNETCIKEGIFLINPQWVHLDENEIKEKLQHNQKILRVKYGGENDS